MHPAPSPTSGSAPTAPRWSRLTRICRPWRMMSCDFLPLMLATKPTPQESCSLRGSYSPCFSGKSVKFIGCPLPDSSPQTNFGMGLLNLPAARGQKRLLVPDGPCNLPKRELLRGSLMSQRSVVLGLGLVLALGACGTYGPTNMYSTPGWYLEKPRLMLAAGPEIFAGPMT